MDAIGCAIYHIGNIHKYVRPEYVSGHTMAIIITDGMENASVRYSSDQVKHMIERQKEQYGLEFLFIGANIDVVEIAVQFGIERNRAVNYSADSVGTQVFYETISAPISAMRQNKPLTDEWSRDIEEDFETRK